MSCSSAVGKRQLVQGGTGGTCRNRLLKSTRSYALAALSGDSPAPLTIRAGRPGRHGADAGFGNLCDGGKNIPARAFGVASMWI